jgi:hypothetical protein
MDDEPVSHVAGMCVFLFIAGLVIGVLLERGTFTKGLPPELWCAMLTCSIVDACWKTWRWRRERRQSRRV